MQDQFLRGFNEILKLRTYTSIFVFFRELNKMFIFEPYTQPLQYERQAMEKVYPIFQPSASTTTSLNKIFTTAFFMFSAEATRTYLLNYPRSRKTIRDFLFFFFFFFLSRQTTFTYNLPIAPAFHTSETFLVRIYR